MATETAAAGSSSTLSGALGATKAFVLAHPVGLTAVGGVLLGIGAYYAVSRTMKKRNQAVAVDTSAAEAEPAAA